LLSFPDWMNLPCLFLPCCSSTTEVLSFLLGLYGEYEGLLSSSPVPAGNTHFPLGPSGHSDDTVSPRPSTLLLLQLSELPRVHPRGPAPGVALAPLLCVDLLHLLLQSALPATPVFNEEDYEETQ